MTRHFGALAVLVALVLAACGGNGPTQGPAATGPATATQGPAATSGDGPLSNPCALLSTDDAQAALGSQALTATPAAGDPASCTYSLADGEEALRIDFLQNGAETQFQTFVDAGSAETISGVGDKALFERGSRRLLFIAGDTLVFVFPKYINGADDALEASKSIADSLLTHL